MNISKLKKLCPPWLKERLIDMRYAIYTKRMLTKHQRVLPYKEGKYPQGINLICDIKAETGLGQSARILAEMLKQSGIPFTIIQVNQTGQLDHNENSWDSYITEEPRYDTNLIHINMNEWPLKYCEIAKTVFDYRRNISFWLWELQTLPKQWLPCIDTVDAIWAPSEFICNCMRKYTEKPVAKVPYYIHIQEPVMYDRTYFGLDEEVFYYLFMYDFKSISARKNPEGMLRAFEVTFPAQEANKHKIGLIIKINHIDETQLQELRLRLQNYQYIQFITRNLDRSEVESLESCADVYISLHRSEGFGLPAAEAMYLGKPVIATDWSATMEFMDVDSACLVKYDLVKLTEKIGPYDKDSEWAEPNVDHARRYIRLLHDNIDYRNVISRKAQAKIRCQLGIAHTTDYLLRAYGYNKNTKGIR